MAEFPYSAAPTKLEALLEKMKTVSPPSKADKSWLQTIGFDKSNDTSMLRVLQFIGFVDGSKVPTNKWMKYRDHGNSKNVLADGITKGYSALYEVYGEAHNCSDEELKNFFRVRSTAGEQSVARTWKTFRVLSSLADFDSLSDNGATLAGNGNEPVDKNRAPLVAPPVNIESPAPTLHIDFQVHIAADAPPEQIDQIFESMAKHLYGKVAE